MTACSGGGSKVAKPSNTAPDDAARAEARDLFAGATTNPAAEQGESDWSIVLVAIRGGNPAAAAVTLDRVRNKAGLRAAYLEKRGEVQVVAYGHYSDPSSEEAKSDIKRIRELKVDGGSPFSGAMLSPPQASKLRGSIPEFNLAEIKRSQGSAAKYTLQIGVYARTDGGRPAPKDLAEFRKAAEEAVVRLRREGEEAFYFHGPFRSMVTVGVFDDHEYDANDPGMSDGPLLKALRARFPYNLVNGAGYREIKQGEKTGRLQVSKVVMIPSE